MRRKILGVLSGLFVVTVSLLGAGCAARRDIGPGKPIAFYDYGVVTEENTGEYYDRAKSILDQSFVVLEGNDPRLQLSSVRQKACTVSIGWAPGFWSTSGWVDLKDLNGEEFFQSSVRRGAFWVGADGDVMESLRDVAAARAEAPPVPPESREPMPPPATRSDGFRTKAQRLTELNELRIQGLISDPEYSKQRAKIIEE
jgi:hypothetical protein